MGKIRSHLTAKNRILTKWAFHRIECRAKIAKRLLIIVGKWRRNQFLLYMISYHKRDTDLWYKGAYCEKTTASWWVNGMELLSFFVPFNEDSTGHRRITLMEGQWYRSLMASESGQDLEKACRVRNCCNSPWIGFSASDAYKCLLKCDYFHMISVEACQINLQNSILRLTHLY